MIDFLSGAAGDDPNKKTNIFQGKCRKSLQNEALGYLDVFLFGRAIRQSLFYLRRILWDLTEIFDRMRGIAREMRLEWDIFFNASDIFFAK